MYVRLDYFCCFLLESDGEADGITVDFLYV